MHTCFTSIYGVSNNGLILVSGGCSVSGLASTLCVMYAITHLTMQHHVIVAGCALGLPYDIVHDMHHRLVITPLLRAGFLASHLYGT